MTFHLDTTGTFHRPTGSAVQGNPNDTVITWATLSPFTHGYIEALFAASSDDLDAQWTASGDWSDAGNGAFGFSDLSPKTLARIISDCERVAAKWQGATEGREFWANRQAGECVRHDLLPLTVTLSEDGRVAFADPAR